MVENKSAMLFIGLALVVLFFITKTNEIKEEILIENSTMANISFSYVPFQTAEEIQEETLDCNTSCIDKGYFSGRGPFSSSQECNFPEIPSSGVCCCLHEEFL